jgi:hypothetical protein
MSYRYCPNQQEHTQAALAVIGAVMGNAMSSLAKFLHTVKGQIIQNTIIERHHAAIQRV